MRHAVLRNYAFDLEYLRLLLADIPEDQMCDQPPGLHNHPAWTVGHLCVGAQFANSLLGQETVLPEGWTRLFARGSKPVADRSVYPDKARLLAEFERCHKEVSRTVATIDEAKLAQETPNPDFRQVAPTLSDVVVFVLVNHTATHLGQIAMWRRAKGLDPVIG
ncbi:MAG: DinB family protein [Thermoguttaceae bacterium]